MRTLPEIFVEEPVQRLMGDNAYDSDQLDRELSEAGVEMIAPHRSNQPTGPAALALGVTHRGAYLL